MVSFSGNELVDFRLCEAEAIAMNYQHDNSRSVKSNFGTDRVTQCLYVRLPIFSEKSGDNETVSDVEIASCVATQISS